MSRGTRSEEGALVGGVVATDFGRTGERENATPKKYRGRRRLTAGGGGKSVMSGDGAPGPQLKTGREEV